ncbi:hypothetical protein SAMN05216391_10984 [Lachnospiraceae bacterium KHCPX20]|nr:hypothetical protein SAMN05216391_10984 [Lachnospiraceae bacterium KHCPX20]
MQKIYVGCFTKDNNQDTAKIARQIAYFLAANDNLNVYFIENEKDSILDQLNRTADDVYNNVHFCKDIGSVIDKGDSTFVVIDQKNIVNDQTVKEANLLYILVDAERIAFENVETYAQAMPDEAELILYGTNDDSAYAKLKQRVIRIGLVRDDRLDGDIKQSLNLYGHRKQLKVPPVDIEYDIESLPYKEKEEEENSNAFSKLIGATTGLSQKLKEKRKKKKTKEEGAASEQKGKNPTDSIQTKDPVEPINSIEEPEKIKEKHQLDISIGNSLFDEKEEDKKGENYVQEQDTDEQTSNKEPIKEPKKLTHIEKKEKVEDYATKIQDLKTMMKAVLECITAVNVVLIILFLFLCGKTVMDYRESVHHVINIKDIDMITYPKRSQTVGLDISNFTGVSENKKYAVTIGDDTFIKPYSEKLTKLKKETTVATDRYEVTVSYSKNPIISSIYGDLTFVHHTALGEGAFTKKDIQSILKYAQAYYTKKQYNAWGFKDKDALKINNPPSSMIRDLEDPGID